jgi:hypothetical protein
MDIPPRTVFKADGTGGVCCSKIRRPSTTPTRLILDVRRERCCCGDKELEQVFEPDVFSHPPQEVLARGVPAHEWREWLLRLQQIIYNGTFSDCVKCMLWGTLIGGAYLIFQDNHMQLRVAALMREFNAQVLEPRGIYAKTQKAVFRTDKQREEISWLAIALDSDEVTMLRQEDNVFWYNPWDGTLTATSNSCWTACYASCLGTPVVV